MFKDFFSKQSLQEALVEQGLLTNEQYEEVIDNAPNGVTEMQAIADKYGDRREIMDFMAIKELLYFFLVNTKTQ